MITLSARNRLGFVTGKYPEPEPQITKTVLYFNTSQEVWKDLQERFGYTSRTQLYALEQQLYELHQGTLSTSKYYTKMKEITFHDYHLSDPIAFNAQKYFSPKDNKGQFYPGSSKGFGYQAFSQNNTASASRPLPGNKRPVSSYFCNYCKVPGHSISRCFKLHGYPPRFKGFKNKGAATLAHQTEYDASHSQPSFPNNSTSELKDDSISFDQYKQFIEFMSMTCLFTSSKSTWILDSGATHHFCCELGLFHDYHAYIGSNNTITIPDGRQILVHHSGTVYLNDHVCLKNVLHVPDFAFDLVSIHKLCQDMDCLVTFCAGQCVLQGSKLTTSPLPLGNVKAGLYHVEEVKPSSSTVSAHVKPKCLASVNEAQEVGGWCVELGAAGEGVGGGGLVRERGRSCDGGAQSEGGGSMLGQGGFGALGLSSSTVDGAVEIAGASSMLRQL
ncbi:Retrovirus-related Pol polyprotein from transposon RE2 [Bienertia sinuspersici]